MARRNSAQSVSVDWKSLPFPLKLCVAKVGRALFSKEGMWALSWIDVLNRPNPFSAPRRKGQPGLDEKGELLFFFAQFFSFLHEDSKGIGDVEKFSAVFDHATKLQTLMPGQYAFSSHSRVLNSYFQARSGCLVPPTKEAAISSVKLAQRDDESLTESQRVNQYKLVRELGLECIDGRKIRASKMDPQERIKILGLNPMQMSPMTLLESLYWWKVPERMDGLSVINGEAIPYLTARLAPELGLDIAQERLFDSLFTSIHRGFANSHWGANGFSIDSPAGVFTTVMCRPMMEISSRDEQKMLSKLYSCMNVQMKVELSNG